MTVGETLSEARYQAGLSVEELSERTKIRDVVIRSIEQNNFEACGGDLYVRGYMRAIAAAIGIDAQPLIREYDLGQTGSANGYGWHAIAHSSISSSGTETTSFDLPAISAAETSFDLPAVPDEPRAPGAPLADEPPAVSAAETSLDLPAVPDEPPAPKVASPEPQSGAPPSAADSPATELDEYPTVEFPVPLSPPPFGLQLDATREMTAAPAQPSPWLLEDLMAAGNDLDPDATRVGANPGRRERRRVGIVAVAAGIVVLAATGLGIDFAMGSGSGMTSATVIGPAETSVSSVAVNAGAAARPSASASASTAAKSSARASKVIRLPVASVTAFGPDGVADGDNPGEAGNAIAARPPRPWSTEWYTTAEFGMLKHGTGLLLDLGSEVTVTAVRFDLPQYQGGNLQLRVGNGQTPQAFQVAATANDAFGAFTLTLRQPATTRYLLIWFTKLPPNGAGMFQESVSHVSVTGRRAS